MDIEELQKLRGQVDCLDRGLMDLLKRRIEVARAIGEAKGEAPVYDPVREREVIDRFLALFEDGDQNALSAIQREVISMCRSVQSRPKVAVMGPEGSFSQEALYRALGHSVQIVFAESPSHVMALVDEGRCDLGVVPVENTVEGVVCPTLDGLVSSSVYVVKETSIPIRHVLAGSSDMESIEKVCSHPQALAQCQIWLKKNLPSVSIVPVASTSTAAYMASSDPSLGAVCSSLASEINGLKIFSDGIQDRHYNRTRFWVVAASPAKASEGQKTSIVFSVSHRPGALLEALEPIRKSGLNMTLIQSRPMEGNPFEYVFFVDLEGPCESVKSAIGEMKKVCFKLRSLGSYEVDRD